METINVSKSILSVSSPGTHLTRGDDAAARKLTRYCNEFSAELKKRKPDQFGFYASLPMPDVQGSLEEISYACDHLNADGFVMMTNHHGIYLGDSEFDAVFDELNRRKAILFIHPTTPCMPSGDAATPTRYPRPMFEFLFDTARVVINLFLTGTVRRCPDITFHIPHVGGAFPPLINRFASVGPLQKVDGIDQGVNPGWVRERLNQQFYFDAAGWAFPEQMRGLLEHVTAERILYGSDFPYTPLGPVVSLSRELDEHLASVFTDKKDQDMVCVGNARRMLKAVYKH